MLHKVGIISAGLSFGDDDILADRCYRGTLKCMSAEGKVYCLPRDQFLGIFKSDNEGFRRQFRQAQIQEIKEVRRKQQRVSNSQTLIQKMEKVLGTDEGGDPSVYCLKCQEKLQSLHLLARHQEFCPGHVVPGKNDPYGVQLESNRTRFKTNSLPAIDRD